MPSDNLSLLSTEPNPEPRTVTVEVPVYLLPVEPAGGPCGIYYDLFLSGIGLPSRDEEGQPKYPAPWPVVDPCMCLSFVEHASVVLS